MPCIDNYVSPSRDNVSNQPPVSPLTSPSSTPETMSSSQNVLNTLLPVTADLRGTEQVSACSSPAPLSPALGSTHGSTISLPEPSVLLNKCLEMSKNTESQVTNFPNPTPQVRLLSRVESLSSLSSLSSDDLSDAPAQVPSAPAPSSRRGKAANVRSWTSPRKTTKSTNKELMDGNSSSLPSQPLHNATSRQFIQCNRCDLWYHWGCVGIRDDDPRLQDDADFACPLCQDHKKPAPRLSLSEEGQGERCSWPDCSLDDDPVEEFYIERIIGRYDRKAKGIERFSWLVKWEGYPAEDSTWTPESELPKPVKLIEEFKSTAEVEGILQFNSTLHLLREAVDAGWADRKV
ncbi:hypothetical protein JB92DRAFT_1281793 [Gautieria morchelliformis]|nr:hypothetical protein JB92DRAFT_1281793 [Gautieria morchelliformis]